jgi:hypothetical protein
MSTNSDRAKALVVRRAGTAAREPWAVVVSALGGGLAWAVGIPALAAVVIAVLMLGVATLVGVFRPADDTRPVADPRLRSGTEQADLVRTLDGYISDLRSLRESRLPEVVMDPAIEALSAAQNAREGVVRTAAAVDGLEGALERSSSVNARWSGAGQSNEISESMQRMQARRSDLLGRLNTAVRQIAEVYTKLLEASATVGGGGFDGDLESIEDVSGSLDSLRTAFAELEVDDGDDKQG